MPHTHHYTLEATWDGNTGSGTRQVRNYSRNHRVQIAGKPTLELTTDNKAVGDPSRLNPEDLLVSAISSCHMLSYLYVCALEGVVVTAYTDHAHGTMIEQDAGGGSFSEVVLMPHVLVEHESMIEMAMELHHKAHEICYIANSVNFPVRVEASCAQQNIL